MSEPGANEIVVDSSNVLLGPDPISTPEMLCAGTLLYFDAPVLLTIPPQVVTQQSFELLDKIQTKSPDWAPRLFSVLSAWHQKQAGTRAVLALLKPLEKEAFRTVWLMYNSNDAALERARELIASAGWTPSQFLTSIDFESACGELARHLFLEKYLELNRNLDDLYECVASVFSDKSYPEILASAYALRLNGLVGLKANTPIALTNTRLVNFLADLPAPDTPENDGGHGPFQKDAVSMMIFNALLANYLDPLTQKRVEALASLRASKRNEIDRFKGRCLAVADKVDLKSNPELLFSQVDEQIRFTVLPQVRDVLELGDTAFRDYKEKLLGDGAFWTAFITTVVTWITGPQLVAAGAATATLARMGASAISHYRDIRQTVRKNDYSLLYMASKLGKQ